MGPLGELGALFNPGMRHEIEERKSKANRREEEGNARDGDLRIDLASGVAVINMSKNGEHPSAPVEGPAAQHDSVAAQSDADGDASAADDSTEEPELIRADSAPSISTPAHHTAETDQATASPGGSAAASDEPATGVAPGTGSLTAAQQRRLAAAARRSAKGDRPARPATPRPANAQLPSSKASRAAR